MYLYTHMYVYINVYLIIQKISFIFFILRDICNQNKIVVFYKCKLL